MVCTRCLVAFPVNLACSGIKAELKDLIIELNTHQISWFMASRPSQAARNARKYNPAAHQEKARSRNDPRANPVGCGD